MEMKTEDTPVRCDGMEEDGAPFSSPYRHYARMVRTRITLRRDGDIAPYRHNARMVRTRITRAARWLPVGAPDSRPTAITHAKFARGGSPPRPTAITLA